MYWIFGMFLVPRINCSSHVSFRRRSFVLFISFPDLRGTTYLLDLCRGRHSVPLLWVSRHCDLSICLSTQGWNRRIDAMGVNDTLLQTIIICKVEKSTNCYIKLFYFIFKIWKSEINLYLEICLYFVPSAYLFSNKPRK